MPDKPQISFGGGILGPETFARLDLSKFSSGVQQATNYFVRAEGSISNRAGFKFIKEAKDSSDTIRLIPFRFNQEQTYALEFGDQYMRVFTDGEIVLEANKTITGATSANPVVITATGHGYSNGDEVYIASVGGMTEINLRFFTVANVTSNTFELSGENGSAYTSYTSGGTVARVYSIATPYADSDLALIKFRQSNDVMFLAHPSYAPRKLSRTGNAAWSITEIDFEPDQAYPTALSVTANTTGSVTYKYKVTAVARETVEESLVGVEAPKTITGATKANPVVISSTSHGYSNGDEVEISGIVGMTELNGRRFIVANVNTNDFQLSGEDSTAYTAYASGGQAFRTHTQVTNGAATADNTISWTAPADAESYNIYKEDNGLYGFIGSTESTTFTDDNIAADLDDTAPKLRQPFLGTDNYPGAVGLHEQRSVWGRTNNKPLNIFLSQTSQFENFNVSSPTRDSDAVTVRLVTGEGGEVRHFRSFSDRLMIFTADCIWSLRPGGDVDAITPASKKLEVEERIPCTDTPPIVIKNNILIVSGEETEGFEVHSLGYNLETDAYAGSDLTVLCRHLFEEFTISEWAYAHRPFRLICGVRNDGKLLVMSYLQEHQIFAWTIWETDGNFESVCSVGEGQTDAIYAVVKRTINSSTVRYIERLQERYFASIENAFFADSGFTVDNTNAQTVTGATKANPVVVTVSSHGYSNGDIVYLTGLGGMTELNDREFTIANKTANTFELAGENGSAYTTYTSGGTAQRYTKTLTNLDHLEGKSIVVLVDGNLETGVTVTDGVATLSNGGAVFQGGIGYQGTLQTLPLDLVLRSGNTVSRTKAVKNVTVRVKDTRGLFVGPDTSNMEEFPSRSTELWGQPAATRTDLLKIPISDDWRRENSVLIQSEPGLPQTILSIIPGLDIG